MTSNCWKTSSLPVRIASIVIGRTREDLDHRSFFNDLVRELELIGEASRGLSDEFKDAHPDVPWSSIVGMRNMLAHVYWDIDPMIVWNAATKSVPQLVSMLTADSSG